MTDFDEERIDIIGQNGNDGIHYEMSRVATLKYRHDMIDEVEIETPEHIAEGPEDRSPGL